VTWDSVPWFVEGGAEHSPNIARVLSYGAFGGREGIIGPTDLFVAAMSTPGNQVRVFPGVCSVLNRAQGSSYESYIGRLPVVDTVTIAPTDSSAGRSDMIVALVKNPYLPGEPWPNPADPKVGPYIVTQVISGVSSNAKSVQGVQPGWSAITLARIDIPVNTSTITNDMITDLRIFSAVRNSRDLLVQSPNNTTTISATSSTFVDFPNNASCRLVVEGVPEWANRAKVRAIIGGVKYGGAGDNSGNGWNIYGDVRIQIAGGSNALYSQSTGYNVSNDGGKDRTILMAGANALTVPPGNRGKTATLRIEANKRGGNTNLTIDSEAMVSLEVEWFQVPESTS
jgi:hypothetical protein